MAEVNMAELYFQGALDLEGATMQWINSNKNPAYLYRGPIEVIQYHAHSLFTVALETAKIARASHDAYKEVFARTIDDMRALRTTAMEADEITEGLKYRGRTLAFRYSATLNDHVLGMKRRLNHLYGMTKATDFLWASLFDIRDINCGGERAENVVQNLAIVLRTIISAEGEDAEDRLSDWDDILYVWPAQMLVDVDRYYVWTQEEAQDAMLWTGMVIFHRPDPDMGTVVDWRRDYRLDGEGS